MEKKKNKKSIIKVICFSLLVVILVASIGLNVYQYVSNKDSDEVAVDDNIIVNDGDELSNDAKDISLEMSIGDSYNFKEILDNSNYSESIENFDESKFTLKYNSDSKVVGVNDEGIFTGVASGDTTIYVLYDKVEYALSINIKEVETSNASIRSELINKTINAYSYDNLGDLSISTDSKYIYFYPRNNSVRLRSTDGNNYEPLRQVFKEEKKGSNNFIKVDNKNYEYDYAYGKDCPYNNKTCLRFSKKYFNSNNDSDFIISVQTCDSNVCNDISIFSVRVRVKKVNNTYKYLIARPPRIMAIGYDDNYQYIIFGNVWGSNNSKCSVIPSSLINNVHDVYGKYIDSWEFSNSHCYVIARVSKDRFIYTIQYNYPSSELFNAFTYIKNKKETNKRIKLSNYLNK